MSCEENAGSMVFIIGPLIVVLVYLKTKRRAQIVTLHVNDLTGIRAQIMLWFLDITEDIARYHAFIRLFSSQYDILFNLCYIVKLLLFSCSNSLSTRLLVGQTPIRIIHGAIYLTDFHSQQLKYARSGHQLIFLNLVDIICAVWFHKLLF